jgi:hypothetical protein
MHAAMTKSQPIWRTRDGKPIFSVEKINRLNDSLFELRAIAQDALEDAILMGCDEAQFREVLHALVEGLESPPRQL